METTERKRFDLIFILIDSKNKAWDKLVSSYILFGNSNPNESKKSWNLEKVQMYISFVGPKSTKMTKKANTILQSYYMVQRKSEHRDPSRTTVRMLDSLVRLSQAHCRLMYRNTILPMDAITAVSLIDLSMQDCTLSDTVDALHSTFHKYPDYEYLRTAKKLLIQLNLYEIWREELLYYGQILQVDHKTLEHDIDKGITRLFAKYDEVSDDNIVLSASLVTSSYFNNKKDKQGFNEDVDNEDNGPHSTENDEIVYVNDKLAKTLKKHAALNKVERNPPPAERNQKKRKRKEVTINTSNVRGKMNKKSKTNKIQITDNFKQNLADSEDDFDEESMLKAVPSVNDVFAELGIDFKFSSSSDANSINNQEETNIKDENASDIREGSDDTDTCTKDNQIIVKNKSQNDIRLNNKEVASSSKIMSKLKHFKFVEKHDLSKYVEKVTGKEETSNDIIKLKDRSDSTSSIISKRSTQNSQISIFESSDCDTVLDI